MSKRRFFEGGLTDPNGGGDMPSDRPAVGRLNQGQNVPSSPRMRSRGGFPQHGLGGKMGFASGPPGAGQMPPPQMQAMPFAGPARSGPVSTFPEGSMQPNPEMDAFRAARAGGAPMKKGGKVAGYAKGGSVKGWGKARGGRTVKIV